MSKEVIKKGEASLIVLNLVIGIIAFGFILGLSSPIVSGVYVVREGKVFNIAIPRPDETPYITRAEAETALKLQKAKPPAVPVNPTDNSGGGDGDDTSETGDPEDEEYESVTKFGQQFGVDNVFLDALIGGATVGGLLYGASTIISSLIGLEDEQERSLQLALTAGGFTYRFLDVLKKEGIGKDIPFIGGEWGPLNQPFLYGVGVAAVIFLLTYKESDFETVYFNCYNWEAPTGGEDCETCNIGEKPCSEYRCKSLGQACELLNSGEEGEELCTWVNPLDVLTPVIVPLEEELTEGYEYTDLTPRPPGGGTEIKKTGADCIEAFVPIQFGINTTEPTQCKVDYNHTADYESMTYYFGETNLYSYVHTQRLNLPGPDILEDQLEIQNDGEYDLYVRCKDANGNYNPDEYVISFCVEPGPDTTPPVIEGTDIINGMPIQYEVDSTPITLYINEPAECKWSKSSQSYDDMENTMACATNIWDMNSQLFYECTGTLTGIEDRVENIFYFRCKDQPGSADEDRNKMVQSYEFKLTGTEPLTIVDLSPNGTITGATTSVNVTLEVETDNGYNDGEAYCYYSPTGDEDDYVLFFETNNYLHTQSQYLTEGDYTYYYKCIDLGGNAAYNQTSFSVEVDTDTPEVVRAYYEEGLKIITNEDATCVYSNSVTTECNYDFEDGTEMEHISSGRKYEHFADWISDKNYYIKCEDENGKQPDPADCSIIVRSHDLI